MPASTASTRLAVRVPGTRSPENRQAQGVDRPVPAIGGLQYHPRRGSGGAHRGFEPSRIIEDASWLANHRSVRLHRDQDSTPPVQIDPDHRSSVM